jgi:hypothetical protein
MRRKTPRDGLSRISNSDAHKVCGAGFVAHIGPALSGEAACDARNVLQDVAARFFDKVSRQDFFFLVIACDARAM